MREETIRIAKLKDWIRENEQVSDPYSILIVNSEKLIEFIEKESKEAK